MKKKTIAMLVLAASSLRCATIARGRYQQVPVDSNPSGASVAVSCADVPRDGGITPARVKVRRGAKNCAITLSKAGYKDQTLTFQRKVAPSVWLNLLPGLAVEAAAEIAAATDEILSDNPDQKDTYTDGLYLVLITGLGVLIDHSTGAMYRQDPPRVDVTLQQSPR